MRLGLMLPFWGVNLREHRDIVSNLSSWGFSEVWSYEVNDLDAFTPLGAVSAWAPELGLGTAIVPAYTRSPALLAQSAAALAELAPGNVFLGLGVSSPTVIENWNGIAFERPMQRIEDTVEFLRRAFAGDKVEMSCSSFEIRGFRLGRVPEVAPSIYLAGLRPKMLELASRIGDGVIVNWIGPSDMDKIRSTFSGDPVVVGKIFCCPTEDEGLARNIGRRMIAEYLNVPAYAKYQEWLGRGPQLEAMWAAWAAGERKQALGEISDDLVDEFLVHGSLETCRARIDEYRKAGVDVPQIALIPPGEIDWAGVLSKLAA